MRQSHLFAVAVSGDQEGTVVGVGVGEEDKAVVAVAQQILSHPASGVRGTLGEDTRDRNTLTQIDLQPLVLIG